MGGDLCRRLVCDLVNIYQSSILPFCMPDGDSFKKFLGSKKYEKLMDYSASLRGSSCVVGETDDCR